jgi:uncharacterized membrane protein YphA (DoxX/SURF4 family)
VFVYASLEKIAHPADFARIVYHYRIVGPNEWTGPLPANLVAVVLPWVEIVAGLLLIAGVWRREAASVLAALLVVFLGAVSWALVRGIDIENCGCFSVTGAGRRAGVTLLLGDALLLLAAGFVLRGSAPASHRQSGEATTEGPR